MFTLRLCLAACALALLAVSGPADAGAESDAPLTVPASTAYFQPETEPDGADVSVEHGVTGWSDPKNQVVWYGTLGAGTLDVRLSLRLPAQALSHLRLTVAGQH